ncbi:diaminopimelate epimerase [Kaarinaea lacus]
MLLTFTKMHGTGNDFVVIDAINQSIDLSAEQLRFIADRHFGIGCDQILLVESPTLSDVDFRYRIFNADGGEVQQCGNGARCFFKFVREKDLSTKSVLRVETLSGIIEIKMQDSGDVTVNMGEPRFEPSALPLLVENQSEEYSAIINNQEIQFGAVSMGNPHAIIEVEDTQQAPVETLGAALESHELFPQRVNVGFMQILDKDSIRLRVYERGVGETLACGTGACAAVAVGIRRGELNNRVTVELSGGNLLIEWAGENNPVYMTGPAQTVFDGKISL